MTNLDAFRPRLKWLVATRWLILAAELAALAMAQWLGGLSLPCALLIGILAVVAATNLALAWWPWRVDSALLSATVAFDIVTLTILLWLSGGPANPFTAVYLVHISCAAALLGSRWTWSLVGLASAAYGILYLGSVELRLTPSDHATQMRVHLQGMWIAFLAAAVLIGHSVTYVQRVIERQRDKLQQALVMRERNQRLTAVATLAAGAAHELATPLSTIAVIAKELERQLRCHVDLEGLVEDAVVLRQQVTRCRLVLDRLTIQIRDEDHSERTSIDKVIQWALHDLERADDVGVEIQPSLRGRRLPWPPRALSVSLRNVIQNALEASPKGAAVLVKAHETTEQLVVEIHDRGVGMAPPIVGRATEAFFTTKTSGKSLGLGLFLTRGLMEQLGINCELRSQPGRGTTVRFTFPFPQGDT